MDRRSPKIGDRLTVLCDDWKFYDGTVVAFDATTHKHKVMFDAGEKEDEMDLFAVDSRFLPSHGGRYRRPKTALENVETRLTQHLTRVEKGLTRVVQGSGPTPVPSREADRRRHLIRVERVVTGLREEIKTKTRQERKWFHEMLIANREQTARDVAQMEHRLVERCVVNNRGGLLSGSPRARIAVDEPAATPARQAQPT